MHFRILHYETLDSTNNLARALAHAGAREGTVVSVEYQTLGRGRFKRRWQSQRGQNLLFSVLLRPGLRTSSAAIMTHLAARAVQDVLKKDFSLPARLKRPNDVMIGSRKIAGILTESATCSDTVEYMIVGIGLNVNSGRQGLPARATSIRIETSKKIDRNELLRDILRCFVRSYSEIACKG